MSMTSRIFTSLAVLTVFAGLGIAGRPAQAQSDADLRRENDALRTRVSDLEADLKAAHDRNSELEEQIRDLKAEIVQLRRTASSGASTLPPLEEEKVTIDESIPEASPRALMKALKGSYDDALSDLDKGAAGSRERNVYVSQVDKWANRVNREYRKQIIWAVRVSDATIGPRGADLMVQAVDPETDALLGPEFPVRVTNKTIARRLQELLQARQLIDGKFTTRR
jgi:hypothetical protein